MTVPNFVVAGAARSGTTALIEALRGHPDVFVTQPKEPHYFAFAGEPVNFAGPGDDETINKVAVSRRQEYLDLYSSAVGAQARGDGSVSTLYYHSASIPALKELADDMRIVIILRNPVDRAYSSYQYLRARGYEPLSDFTEAVAQEPQRIEDGWHHLWHYTSMSTYADAVEHFLDEFGRDGVGVWFYDDFIEDGRAVVSDVCRFLDLDPERLPDHDLNRVNVSGRPRSEGIQTVIRNLGRHEGVKRVIKKMVPFEARERIRSANLTRSEVPPEVREELDGLFQEDCERLRRLLATPLPGWLGQDRSTR